MAEELRTEVPTLPPPVEIPEYFPGFTQQFERMGGEFKSAFLNLEAAQKNLDKPLVSHMTPIPSWLARGSLYALAIEPALTRHLTEEQLAQIKAPAIAEFDAAARTVQGLEWKFEMMNVAPLYLSDPYFDVKTAQDLLQHIEPGFELTDEDMAWLEELYGNMEHLSNVLPEDFRGDILETQAKLLEEILSRPKLEMRGIHHLTVDEIAKAFAFGVPELPEGLSEQQVRALLAKMDLSDEELKDRREWLADRAREWEIESAKMNLIRAGAAFALKPELTPAEWGKMIVTQPMLATVELMQGWWDAISRPLSAAITMHLPAPVAGLAHGAPLGTVAGGITAGIIGGMAKGLGIGAVGGPIGMAGGALIGGIVGAVAGTVIFSIHADKWSEELHRHYSFYRDEMGEGAWSSYAKAFNEWDAPWWQKAIMDSAYDPLYWLGWGGATAVGQKLKTIGYTAGVGYRHGLKGAGARVGHLVSAFEQGYVTGADAIFKGGVQVVAAPIKSAFWLTGAGYTIPRTYTMMARNFARKSMMDFKAVLERLYPEAGGLRGLTPKQVMTGFDVCVDAFKKTPTEGNIPYVRAGASFMEFNYLDDIASNKFMKAITGELTWDTPRLARFNNQLADFLSGGGERMTAGKMFGELGIEPTTAQVNQLAKKLVDFQDATSAAARKAITGDAGDVMLESIFKRMEDMRHANLHSPFTKYMQQAGRSASWHSRVADKVLYSSRLIWLERKIVHAIARQQLLFSQFGPWAYGETAVRSFLGGAEVMHPLKYGGVQQTNRYLAGLAGHPHELVMFEKGFKRMAQAMVDPKTGQTVVFRKGRIPFVTRDVSIPEKLPIFGGKKIGAKIRIGDQDYFLGSFADGYDFWADFSSKQLAFDYEVHYFKALAEIDPTSARAFDGIMEKNKYLIDNIPSIRKEDAWDIMQAVRKDMTLGPEAIRAQADIDVLEMQRRKISYELNKIMDNFHDIPHMAKQGIREEVLDGRMFAKGTGGIDGSIARKIAGVREHSLASLEPQLKALKEMADGVAANPPKNLKEFMGEMQNITSTIEAVGETLHDFRRTSQILKKKLIPQERDAFEAGAAKIMARYMDASEADVVRIINQLQDNAKGIMDAAQLARLDDLMNVSRLEMENIVATRTSIATIREEIPPFHKRVGHLWKDHPDRAAKISKEFWDSQDARVGELWDIFEDAASNFKSLRLKTSRNFLQATDYPVDKAFVPDWIPDVVGELTPSHVAYLYGSAGDDLYRLLTRAHQHTTIRPKKDFIIHVRDQADAYAAKFGKTADQLGFTDQAISDVYDQMWRSLGIDPTMLTPDHPTILQFEELRQELHRWQAATRIPESDVVKWRQYINTVADEVDALDIYAKAPPELYGLEGVPKAPLEEAYRATFPIGQKHTFYKAVDVEPAARGIDAYGKGYYVSPSKGGAAYWGKDIHTVEATIRKPLVVPTDSDLVDAALKAGYVGDKPTRARVIEWARSEGYDAVVGKSVHAGHDHINIIDKKVISVSARETPTIKFAEPGVSGTPDWWATKEAAVSKAREMHKLSYPTYDDANIIDESMRAIFPFWNYELFRWRWIPRTFMRTPGTLTGLARYMHYTDSGYTPVPGTDLQINPIRGTVWLGGLRSFWRRDFPEYHDAAPGMEFLHYIGRAGFFPGIHVMLPIVMLGDPERVGGVPQWGQMAPRWLKTSLSGLRALSPEHIGKVLEIVYPDRFRDYMSMVTLASWGHDGDEIWKKKKQNIKLTEEEEKLWLRAVNEVDGLKGVLMNQTGLFRIRPEEFGEIRKEMHLAIEEATGVPVPIQEWIDKTYPVTGKRFTDYFHLDIQQQALLYQWETYRRYQGIMTPLYPSSWQALDIRISDYYQELSRVFEEARYHGRYDEEGKLLRPSMTDINRDLIEGKISPGSWRSQRSSMQQGLAEAAYALGESPLYKDVPKTFEERVEYLKTKGIPTPTQTPDQELLYYYYELKPEYKYDWEMDRMELDFDSYYAMIDALLESLSPQHRERLLERIQSSWTPMELLYWEFSRDFGRPYRNLREIVIRSYTPEQQQIIRRFEVARGDERTELQQVIGPDGKLISSFQKKLREARLSLRTMDPELDAWLNFFGTTDKLITRKAEEIYADLRSKYLTEAMIGYAKQ